MTQWFECKVRFDKTIENGQIKKVTEPYLIEALTYTEAEARFLKEIEPFVKGMEYEVTDIKKTRLSEIFFSDNTNDDRWFKAKLAFISLDEKTGQEKRINHIMMVQAQDLCTAIKYIDKVMHGILCDYLITAIQETNILDVIRFTPETKEKR